MSKKNFRTTYSSGRTKAQMDNLPRWIYHKRPSDTLWKLLNAPNILVDEAQEFITDTKNNMLPHTFNPGSLNPIFISTQQISDPSSSYSSESGNITITTTEELEDFFYGPPTRVVGETGDARTVPDITRVPIDVHYIEDIQVAAGQDDVNESGGQIVVLQENAYSDSDAFTFFDSSWNKISVSDVEVATQDFANQPQDEWVYPSDSGNLFYQLKNIPLKDTVVIRNVLSLDAWGTAQQIPTTYSESGKFVVFDEDILGSGQFIAEYDFVPSRFLRSFGPTNYRGLVGVQGANRVFVNSIHRQSSNEVTMDPAVDMQLDASTTHKILRVNDRTTAKIESIGIVNSQFYLKFLPDELRPGMKVIVDYRNAVGQHSQHEITAEKLSSDYGIYDTDIATYMTGVDVTSLLPADRSTFIISNFSVTRYVDYASIVRGMEIHVYDDGQLGRNPIYSLDRVGQYIEERAPESGGFVRRNLIGHTYSTSNLPDLRTTHPEVQTVMFRNSKLLDPSIPSSTPIAMRRWGSWLLVLRKNNAASTPYSRFFEPTNQGETRAYQMVLIDIDTFEEYSTLDLTLNFEATSFTIDDNEKIHIVGYTGLAKADATTPHTITISSSLVVTTPAETIHEYDVVNFTLDAPAATGKIRIKHIPSDTVVYESDTSHSGEFTSDGWGTYMISGEYDSTFFSKTFEIEPTTNRRIFRQALQFKYDYAISVPIDEENEVVYFREHYKWGVDRNTTDA